MGYGESEYQQMGYGESEYQQMGYGESLVLADGLRCAIVVMLS